MDTLHSWDFMDDLRNKRLSPGYSIHEDEANHKFNVTMDLPGVKMEDVNVQVEDDQLLSIKGHRKKTGENGDVSEMKFERKFRLANIMDSDHIVASLADGVLNVSIPKLTEENCKDHIKKIEVMNGSGEVEC
jgi:HSP20 family protein